MHRPYGFFPSQVTFMSTVKIVATLGPATATKQRIADLVRAGMDAARLNFSHGSHEDHAQLVKTVREVAQELDKPIAILQDLQGPRIRTGSLKDGRPVLLQVGASLVIMGEDVASVPGVIGVTHPELYRYVGAGQRILLDNGLMELRVEKVEGGRITCRVIRGGELGANKGINVPVADLGLPSFTEKDREDLAFGLDLGVDWIAMSFVSGAADILPVRQLLKARRMNVPVMAKIERATALDNLPAILEAFDGIMVARGDLGVELPPEDVPVWQKAMVTQARQRGKATIVATQMLESMMHEPRPTRAEASDVANAVLDGADAVMLSGETAIGAYPVETVAVMARIIQKAQALYKPQEPGRFGRFPEAEAVARAACSLTADIPNTSIVVLTQRGMTASLVSKHRPLSPVFALTPTPEMARQLALRWGVTPIPVKYPTSTEEALALVSKVMLDKGLSKPGDQVIVVGSTPFARWGRTNFLKVHRITA